MQHTYILGVVLSMALAACSTPIPPTTLPKPTIAPTPQPSATMTMPSHVSNTIINTNIMLLAQNIGCDETQQAQNQAAILQALNAVRSQPQQCGKIFYPATEAVTWNDLLAKSATAHAQDIAQRRFLSHYGTQGQGLRERIKLMGYQGGAGENLASGQKNVDEVIQNWLSLSPGHCDNLMQKKYKHAALVCVRNPQDQRPYWVLHLGIGKK